MAERKTLVVYYSRTGTTKLVAEAVARALSCDVEEVVDKKKRGGPIRFAAAGMDAARKKLTEIEPPQRDPGDYDLVVIGTPVWAWTMCCAIRTYITQQKDRLPEVALFLTTGGTGVERTFGHMAELCGKEPVARLALKTKQVRKEDWSEQLETFVGQLRG